MSTSPQIPQSDRARFPGLLPVEIVVLKAWLRLHESEYDSFDYNVRLGAGVEPPEGTPDYLREMAILNTQKRVDAVARRAGVPLIIEVKDRANIAAVGQVLGYGALWRAEGRAGGDPLLLLVCARAEPDVFTFASAHSVSVEVVTVPTRDLLAARGF